MPGVRGVPEKFLFSFCRLRRQVNVNEKGSYFLLKKDNQAMTTCERCGNDIPDNIAICPNCGTVTLKAKRNISPTSSYGTYSDRYDNQSPPFKVTVFHSNNSAPLIVELLMSIFLGIFGVGWLMAGEVAIGIVLLVCSFFIYIPLLIISIFIAFFTFGISLFCTGPLVIGAIALNAILLNNRLKRKASSYMQRPPN